MEEVLYTNVFFMITSVAVVVFTLLVCIAVYYMIRILRTITRITERADEESQHMVDAIHTTRRRIRQVNFVRMISNFIAQSFNATHKSHTRRSKRSDDT